MKIKPTIIVFLQSMLLTYACFAQQDEISADIFSHLQSNAHILHDGDVINGAWSVKEFAASFKSTHGAIKTYKKDYDVEVNAKLNFEIGELQTGAAVFAVMFLKNKRTEDGPTIDFLVIYQNKEFDIEASVLDPWRNKWMELCNAHQAGELVSQLYTPDACYYNRGRLLRGTKAITTEYGYMNSPNYSLTLTPKHIVMVAPDIAYEIGRCSGSYPLPYMLVWEKQEDGKWMVLMDSNY